MTQPPQPPHEPHRKQPQGTPPPPWSPQPPPGLQQPPPVYNGPGNAAKSSIGPIIAAVLGIVLVALIALVSTIAITSSSNSSAAETRHTPKWEPDEHITSQQSTSSLPETTTSATTTTTTDNTSSATDTSRSASGTSGTVTSPSGPEPVHKLADHPLFAGEEYGLQNFACDLPRWETTPAAAERFFRGAKECLDRSWKQLLRGLDLPFREPSLKFPSGRTWSSPCTNRDADTGTTASYCGSNETIYLPFEAMQTEQYGAHPGVYLALFAHEYGHHVQYLSGILDTSFEQRDEVGFESAEGLELSRRAELQAQCFSGMFLGSAVDEGGDVNQQIYREAWNTQERGDEYSDGPRDHGTAEHASAWWQQGATTNRTHQCNTWAADSADVS